MLLYVVGACKQEEITSKNFSWWQLSKAFASANQMGHFFKNDLHVSSVLWIGPLSGEFTVPECSKYYDKKKKNTLLFFSRPRRFDREHVHRSCLQPLALRLSVFSCLLSVYFLLRKKDITLIHIWGHLSHHFLFLWKGYASNKHIILIIADCWVGQDSQCRYWPVRRACIMADGL